LFLWGCIKKRPGGLEKSRLVGGVIGLGLTKGRERDRIPTSLKKRNGGQRGRYFVTTACGTRERKREVWESAFPERGKGNRKGALGK